MAEAGRRHLHLDFAPAGGAKVELHNFERLRFRVGRRKAGLAKNGGLNAHGRVSEAETPMLGEIGGWGNWKINPPRARSCVANALAPHRFRAASSSCGRRPEHKPCRRPTAAFSTTSRVS